MENPKPSAPCFQKEQKRQKYSLFFTFTFCMLSKGFRVARPQLGPTPRGKGVFVPSNFPGSAAQKGTREGSGVNTDPTSREGKGLSLQIYCCQGPGDLVQLVDSRNPDGDPETKGLVSGGVETDTGVEKDNSFSRAPVISSSLIKLTVCKLTCGILSI